MVKNDKTPLFHHKFVYLKRFKVNYLVMSWTTWSGFQVAQFATWKFGRALSTDLCNGPKFRAAAPNIVADQNLSVILNLVTVANFFFSWVVNKS